MRPEHDDKRLSHHKCSLHTKSLRESRRQLSMALARQIVVVYQEVNV